ncbi:glycosyl hydrolase family 61-domain-containing protein [Cerioporus squamosus]|nr:glycosyl hydrolase family 61-domain-containing protein [Cerioporus squamosus]
MMRSAVLIALSAALPYVAAHGFVSQVVIDGVAYAGSEPGNDQGPSPIRLVSEISPVKGASNPDLFCGLKAQVAEVTAPANPGSNFTIQWSGGGGQLWPHNTGPLMTYMAACGSSGCDKLAASDAQWFKIDQAGKKSNGDWVQADISKSSGPAVIEGRLLLARPPRQPRPGDYLIRHEIIALHLAVSKGGAEFYPSCTQVRISGSGTGTPNDTVQFPGAYSDTDPGIFDPSVFDDDAKYVFPGPAISNLAATDEQIGAPLASASFHSAESATATGKAPTKTSGASSTHVSSPSGTGSSGASPSANAASSSSKAQCRLKASATASVYPRHYSRIMRRILHTSI